MLNEQGMTPVNEWLSLVDSTQHQTIKDQVLQLDTTGNGIGFIIYIAMCDDYNADDGAVCGSSAELVSKPIVKLKGLWHVIIDETFSDISAAMFRAFSTLLNEHAKHANDANDANDANANANTNHGPGYGPGYPDDPEQGD